MTTKAVAPRTMELLKQALNADSVQEQFENALQENKSLFIASIIDLVGSNAQLQQCDPNALIREALKAAILKLPLNSQLGFAWIVPYKVKGVPTPQFQIGYKGLVQLAIRTGQYRSLNADTVYEGETVKKDRITGDVSISGARSSNKAQGYLAYLALTNGFTKSIYMTLEEIMAHAKRFSKSYGNETSAWATDFDSMALKTVLRRLLSKYGVMSIEMANVLASDRESDEEEELEREKQFNANQEIIDIPEPTYLQGGQGEAGEEQGTGPDF